MSRAQRIESILKSALNPSQLNVEDDSLRHVGHAAMSGHDGNETHFNVLVISAAFAGMSRVARHRRVNELLADEWKNGLHALSIQALTPDESVHKS